MALDTFTPPVGPSPGTEAQHKPRLKKAAFGDGYSQITRDGINHDLRTVPLKWDALTVAEADAIEGFLTTKGGDTPFLYALANDTVRQWRCEEWNRGRSVPATISATFIEDVSIVP